MSEKEKSKVQKHTLIITVPQKYIVMLIVSLLCCGLSYAGLHVKDFFTIRDCSKSRDFLEWDGLFDSANAPQSDILITEQNVAQLSFLGMFSDSLPTDNYARRGRKHPQQAYSLHSTFLPHAATVSYLVVCQPNNNFASHVFSGYIQGYSFSPDAQFFAFANGLHSEVLIYDANTLEFYGQIGLGTYENDRYTLEISKIAFHPTEPLIVLAVYDRPTVTTTIQYWNYKTLSFVGQEITQEGRISFMAFNAEGTELFIRVDDNDILAYGIAPE